MFSEQLACVRRVQRRAKDGVKALGLDGGLPVVQGDDVVQNTQRRKNDAEVWEGVEHKGGCAEHRADDWTLTQTSTTKPKKKHT